MSEARLTVLSSGPLISYQDAGRFGMMRFGVPASGPMDRLAHAVANVAVGRPPQSTAIEISARGVDIACADGAVTFCVAGGHFQIVHGGKSLSSWCVRTLRAGQVLSIRPGRLGNWAYLAFSGELSCDKWAGRTATHVRSGLGGGQLIAGSKVLVCNSEVDETLEGQLEPPLWLKTTSKIRVVLGPQTALFGPAALNAFLQQEFVVTPAFDRMGMRLAGPKLGIENALSVASEPIVRGSIQVAGDGVPSVLLADHQTTGGYPKIATVLSCDTDRVSQLRPGQGLAFEAVSVEEAVRLVRTRVQVESKYLQYVAEPRMTLNELLMSRNLISGFDVMR